MLFLALKKVQNVKITPPQTATTQSKNPQAKCPIFTSTGGFPLDVIWKILVSDPQNVGKILNLSAGL